MTGEGETLGTVASLETALAFAASARRDWKIPSCRIVEASSGRCVRVVADDRSAV
jgi:hypothetical protein